MKQEFWKEMKSLGTTNPDFSPDELGNIMLRNPDTGRVVKTNVPLELFKK